jgi:3-polyprenyl-4-hydroxybenzoate decarboxylase
MFVVPKVFCNRLDPSSVDGMSAKIGIDATKPPQFEGNRTRLPKRSVEWAREFLSRPGR